MSIYIKNKEDIMCMFAKRFSFIYCINFGFSKTI